MTKIEITTEANLFGTCVDAAVSGGPSWAKNFRNSEFGKTHEEAFAKVVATMGKRFPKRTFEFTHVRG